MTQAQLNVRNILLQEFLNAQSRNANFSMRAYARKVGIPQSAVSEILSGKRKITAKMAEKILEGLGLDPQKIQETVAPLKVKAPAPVSNGFRALDIDTFHLVSDWHYFALLSLAETPDFQSDPGWIAKRLGITVPKAQEALERLARLEMVETDGAGTIRATGVQFQVDPGIATPALKKAQRQNLELAQEALEKTEFAERDFTAITLCFDPKRMGEAKALVKEFRQRFCELMESGDKKEVYKLNVQLFPLTKRSL